MTKFGEFAFSFWREAICCITFPREVSLFEEGHFGKGKIFSSFEFSISKLILEGGGLLEGFSGGGFRLFEGAFLGGDDLYRILNFRGFSARGTF